MPGLVGGFFRRGQAADMLNTASIYTDYLFNNRNGSRLNTVVPSNEVGLWGSTKWEKSKGRICLSTLPCLAYSKCLTWVNYHFKIGSPTNNQLPYPFRVGLKSQYMRKGVSGSVLVLVSLRGHTETGRDVIIIASCVKQLDSLRSKRGNPGNSTIMIAEPDRIIIKSESLTCYYSNHMIELNSLDGGKTAEKANARGNSRDTRKTFKTLNNTGLLFNSRLQNSVSLNKVWHNRNVRFYSTQDLCVVHNRLKMSKKTVIYPDLSSQDIRDIQEKVLTKQIELVKLAEQLGTHDKKVFDLQLKLVRSKTFRVWAALLMRNKSGSQTAGVDKAIFDKTDPEAITEMAKYLREVTYHPSKYQASPIKRVWIPKPGKSEKRPLGIPSINDRTVQTLVNLVLYPLVELTSDPNSYGFRGYRDCKMAIAAVRMQLRSVDAEKAVSAIQHRFRGSPSKKRFGNYIRSNESKYILDADIKGFFDNINHQWLIDNLFLHPILKGFVKKWLEAQILDGDTFTSPINGTPQGGIISPTLANFTLNGLENTVEKSIHPVTTSKEQRKQIKLKDGSYTRLNMATKVVRYADDFIITTRSRNLIDKYIKPAVEAFLKERGLWLSPEKTKIFNLAQKDAQLDFLGYTFKYQQKWSSKRTMVFSKTTKTAIALFPEKKKVRNFIQKLKEIFSNSQNLTAMELISKLNPIIRGWGNYYNMENSSHYRSVVRNALYELTWKWIRRKHPTLGKTTLAKMYFLKSNKDIVVNEDQMAGNKPTLIDNQKEIKYVKLKNTKWVFRGISRTKSRYSEISKERTSYLQSPSGSTKIVTATKYIVPLKLRMVHAFHERIDELIKYKLNLALLATPEHPTLKDKLFKKQNGLCTICEKPIDHDKLMLNQTHIHHINPIYKGGNKFALKNLALTHIWCHREHKH